MTRKITMALCRIKLGIQKCLYLGNLDAKRDWGHAKDYVEMQWLMLQQDEPKDFVVATGIQYSVRDFVSKAANILGIDLHWEGQGVSEYALDSQGNKIVAVDPLYYRPTEVETLLGNSELAYRELGWSPKISFDELLEEMIESDLLATKRLVAASTIN